MRTIEDLIYQLEKSLLSSDIRKSPTELDKLLADDFIEFGSTGRVYNKRDVIQSLPLEDSRDFSASDFYVRKLSEDIVLVTYKTIKNKIVVLRSSIWKRQNSDWLMVFHQGTKESI